MEQFEAYRAGVRYSYRTPGDLTLTNACSNGNAIIDCTLYQSGYHGNMEINIQLECVICNHTKF